MTSQKVAGLNLLAHSARININLSLAMSSINVPGAAQAVSRLWPATASSVALYRSPSAMRLLAEGKAKRIRPSRLYTNRSGLGLTGQLKLIRLAAEGSGPRKHVSESNGHLRKQSTESQQLANAIKPLPYC